MLGLDGSFVFLEHVFWVVSLNTLFILLFAYFPHQMGKVFVKRDTFIIQSFQRLNRDPNSCSGKFTVIYSERVKHLYGDKELAFRRCHKYYNRLVNAPTFVS